jgi:hypothetical protein
LFFESKENVFDVDVRNEQTGGLLHFICEKERILPLKQLPSCGSSAFRKPSLRPVMCSMTYEAASFHYSEAAKGDSAESPCIKACTLTGCGQARSQDFLKEKSLKMKLSI